MTLRVFLLFSVVASLYTVWATDYCNPELCKGQGAHIGCNANHNLGPKCPADAVMIRFNRKEQHLIVDGINKHRNFIAGGGDPKHLPACRMATIQWDNELAQLATLNAKQCYLQHDACRNTDAFKYSGQNLAWMEYTPPLKTEEELRTAIQLWYDEVAYSGMKNIRKYPINGNAFGHFTVLVADKNIRVGCGASTFSRSGSTFKSLVLACNFATSNIINHPIYKDCSKPAIECTSGTNPLYPNLCSEAEVYNVNKIF